MQPEHVPANPAALPLLGKELPLPQIVDHIVRTYHVPLRVELQQLRSLFLEVLAAAPAAQRSLLDEMGQHLSALCDELYAHMDKEEKVLFPWIRAGRGASARAPIKVMQHEHQQTRKLLTQLRTLSERNVAGGAASPADQALAARLTAIEAALLEHMELEESVFQRALAS